MKVYGKINLCLRVKNVEKGFHNIDSVMTKIDMYDNVDLNRRERGNLVNALYDGRNTALLALELIQRHKKIDFYSIDIQKGIPFKAGLGGSSADAGFVIRYFLNRGDISLKEALKISDLVGKDVAFFLDDYPKRVKGLQDDISTIEIASPLHFIFIKPHGGVSTTECYELFDKNPCHSDGDIDELKKFLRSQREKCLSDFSRTELFYIFNTCYNKNTNE